MPSRTKPLLRSALFTLLVCGLLLMLWPAGQSAYGWWSQRALRASWRQAAEKTQPTRPSIAPHLPVLKAGGTKNKTHSTRHSAKTTRYAALPPTRIVIPQIGLDAVVVQGMDSASLSRGPGHDPNSAAPGQPGNCVIAAHSNIYGAWFADLDQLYSGCAIELQTPRHVYTYTVLTSTQVSQSDTSVLTAPADGSANLTLITCTKPASIYRQIITGVLNEEN